MNSVYKSDLKYAVNTFPDLIHKTKLRLPETKYVLMKPNICGIYHPSMELLSSIIDFLLIKAEIVIIGETQSMMYSPQEQYKRLGVNKLVENFNGRLRAVDLSDDDIIEVEVPHPHALDKLQLPETVLKSEILVNVPKIGTHSTTRITGSLKNLFGLLPQKRKYSLYHPLGMDEVIADLAKIVNPNLTVLETKSDILLGFDPLAVDIVACSYVNVDPLKVEHLKLVTMDRNLDLETFIDDVELLEI